MKFQWNQFLILERAKPFIFDCFNDLVPECNVHDEVSLVCFDFSLVLPNTLLVIKIFFVLVVASGARTWLVATNLSLPMEILMELASSMMRPRKLCSLPPKSVGLLRYIFVLNQLVHPSCHWLLINIVAWIHKEGIHVRSNCHRCFFACWNNCWSMLDSSKGSVWLQKNVG